MVVFNSVLTAARKWARRSDLNLRSRWVKYFFLFFPVFFGIFQGFSGSKKVEKRNWRCRDGDNRFLDSGFLYKAFSFTKAADGTARSGFQAPCTHTFSFLPGTGDMGNFLSTMKTRGAFLPLPALPWFYWKFFVSFLCHFCCFWLNALKPLNSLESLKKLL